MASKEGIRPGDEESESPQGEDPGGEPADGRVALVYAYESVDKEGEGFRVGGLGETKSGKTTLMRAIAQGSLSQEVKGEPLAHFIVCHDSATNPQLPDSVQLAHPSEFRLRGTFLDGEPPAVSFRGDPIRDIECPVEDVAALSLELARKGRMVDGKRVNHPHVLWIDELDEALTAGGKGWVSPSARKAFTQGRKMGVSTVWSTQNPRRCLEAISQSSMIAIFRLSGGDRNYLRGEAHELDEDMCDILPDLPNYHFVLYRKAEKWDGLVYKLPAAFVT